MFKNAVMAMAAIAALLSGLAMVSAYESHVVNVQASVQNALSVQSDLNFGLDVNNQQTGAVFPQEWLNQAIKIGLSGSFCSPDQQRVSHVEGKIYFEEKQGFHWLGDALYLLLKGGIIKLPIPADEMVRMDPPGLASPRPDGDKPNNLPPLGAVLAPLRGIGSPTGPHFIIDKAVSNATTLIVGLDVPVFEAFYNPETDISPKASGLTTGPTVIIGKNEKRHNPNGVLLGVDLKIQVTSIHNPSGVSLCGT